MPDMHHWVVGLLFNAHGDLALELKTHPVWQAGKLNGVGGKVEGAETPLLAMRREFAEEAGVDIAAWREFAILKLPDGDVHFFVARGDYVLKSLTDELVSWYTLDELKTQPLVRNMDWLIALALDPDNKLATVDYR